MNKYNLSEVLNSNSIYIMTYSNGQLKESRAFWQENSKLEVSVIASELSSLDLDDGKLVGVHKFDSDISPLMAEAGLPIYQVAGADFNLPKSALEECLSNMENVKKLAAGTTMRFDATATKPGVLSKFTKQSFSGLVSTKLQFGEVNGLVTINKGDRVLVAVSFTIRDGSIALKAKDSVGNVGLQVAVSALNRYLVSPGAWAFDASRQSMDVIIQPADTQLVSKLKFDTVPSKSVLPEPLNVDDPRVSELYKRIDAMSDGDAVAIEELRIQVEHLAIVANNHDIMTPEQRERFKRVLTVLEERVNVIETADTPDVGRDLEVSLRILELNNGLSK